MGVSVKALTVTLNVRGAFFCLFHWKRVYLPERSSFIVSQSFHGKENNDLSTNVFSVLASERGLSNEQISLNSFPIDDRVVPSTLNAYRWPLGVVRARLAAAEPCKSPGRPYLLALWSPRVAVAS